MHLRLPFATLTCLALSATLRADSLTLNLVASFDISSLNLGTIGDIGFAAGTSKLWICGGSTGGDVVQLNPVTGTVISQFDPAGVPWLDLGPDALALPRTGLPDVVVFSSFGESEGGRLTSTGALVSDFNTSHGATGADFDVQGHLWIAAGTTAGGGSTLVQLDPTGGAVLASVPILGTTLRVVDLAFDPHTHACYCLLESYQLVEVDTTSGVQLSSTDLSTFLPGATGVAGGVGFSTSGSTLFVAASNGATQGSVIGLSRDFGTVVCDGTSPSAPCPCGNSGLPGRGCNNSFATGGARLSLDGIPRVTNDNATLEVTGLPSSAPTLFFQGTALSQPGPLAIDDGLICIGGSVVRLATRAASSGAVAFPTGTDPDLHARGSIPPAGGTRFYQAWYRNAAAFCTPGTSNFSNAIEVLWVP